MIQKRTAFSLILPALFTLACTAQSSEQTAEGAGEGTAWSMKAEILAVDNCPTSCPCLFGEEPAHGHCRYVAAVQIQDGNYGGTSLNGAKWALLGEFTGKSSAPHFAYSAYYIDSNANEAQREALREILSGAPFSTMGEQLGIKEISIQIEKSTEEKRYTLLIGDHGEFSVVPVYGNDPSTPLKVVNPVYPFPVKEIIVGLSNGQFSDHGKDLNLENTGAEMGEFELSGKK